MAKIYEKEYEIMYHNCDKNLNCKLTSIIDFICDVGTEQSESVGDSISYLTEKRLAWVFYQYDISVNKYPKYRDKIKIITTPIGFNKFYGTRRYDIYNEEGEAIAEGKALFFLINIDKRRPSRILDEQYLFYGVEGDNPETVDKIKIRYPEQLINEDKFTIRHSDIDSNGHVNNEKYVQLALEVVPEEILYEYRLENAQVVFIKETTYGDKVTIKTAVEEKEENVITYHRIYSNTGKELTNLKFIWKK